MVGGFGNINIIWVWIILKILGMLIRERGDGKYIRRGRVCFWVILYFVLDKFE